MEGPEAEQAERQLNALGIDKQEWPSLLQRGQLQEDSLRARARKGLLRKHVDKRVGGDVENTRLATDAYKWLKDVENMPVIEGVVRVQAVEESNQKWMTQTDALREESRAVLM